MKNLLFRSLATATLVLLPASAISAQDSRLQVVYSEEELDNLVAPIALYPDALLAQILVAATFPDQVAVAAQYVRERGARGIDEQGWDISVKAVAHYPPVLNMLANQDDWATALGQAYASQSSDLMDAVQRLREMARAQGNLVSTDEHTVSYDRERIVIVPANPQVIYVPTYDPYVVYARPVFGFGFHAGYFSFGIGFPIGSWLVYDVDWYGRRVYYDGWYGGGWRTHARRYIHITPVYVHPRYRVINININIFSRHVNYVNLDRRHRYVHRTASWERHDRDWSRYGDRDGWGDDRRGSGRGSRDANDRIGNRVASFDDYRPDRTGSTSDARDAQPGASGGTSFGTIDKRRTPEVRPGSDFRGNGTQRAPAVKSQPRPQSPVFSSPPKSTSQKVRPSTARPSPQVQPSKGSKASSGGGNFRSAPSSGVGSAPSGGSFRSTPSGAKSAPPAGSFRSAPSGGGSARSAPSGGNFKSAPSGGGSVRSAPSGGNFRSAPSSGGAARSVQARPSSSAKVKSSGGGGKGRKPQ